MWDIYVGITHASGPPNIQIKYQIYKLCEKDGLYSPIHEPNVLWNLLGAVSSLKVAIIPLYLHDSPSSTYNFDLSFSDIQVSEFAAILERY